MITRLLSMAAFACLSTQLCVAIMMASTLYSGQAAAQSEILPPTLGQETKGQPSNEAAENASQPDNSGDDSTHGADDDAEADIAATTTFKESKRESGQRYLIELNSSLGPKQYIHETDSDGKIESTSNDIEETPNLPKWKLGSW